MGVEEKVWNFERTDSGGYASLSDERGHITVRYNLNPETGEAIQVVIIATKDKKRQIITFEKGKEPSVNYTVRGSPMVPTDLAGPFMKELKRIPEDAGTELGLENLINYNFIKQPKKP